MSYAGELMLSLALTIIVYLIFPIVYVKIQGKVGKRKANILSAVNSIVCAILFCVIRAIISGGQTVVSSLTPAFVYFWIGRAILIDKEIEEPERDKKSKKNNNDNGNFLN